MYIICPANRPLCSSQWGWCARAIHPGVRIMMIMLIMLMHVCWWWNRNVRIIWNSVATPGVGSGNGRMESLARRLFCISDSHRRKKSQEIREISRDLEPSDLISEKNYNVRIIQMSGNPGNLTRSRPLIWFPKTYTHKKNVWNKSSYSFMPVYHFQRNRRVDAC